MRLLKYTILMFAAMFTLSRCTDADYNDKYTDPSKVSTTSIDKLFTGLLKEGSDYVTPNYWRFFAFDNQNVGAVCQTWGMYVDKSLYEGGYPAYTDEGWTKFQKVLTQYKVLEKLYNDSGEAIQSVNKAYYLAGKAFMYQCMLQTLDCWGDIPFKEAGLLPIEGKVVYPKLDNAKDLYELLLTDLGKISNDIAKAGSISPSADFINDGDISKWEKYVNSIYLRAAIRVSSQGDLKTQGEEAVKDILGGKGKPVVTGSNDMIKVVNRRNALFDWSRLEGCTDWRECRLASKAMIDALRKESIEDPRLKLIYDPVLQNAQATSANAGTYVGVNTHDSEATVATLIDGKNANTTCQYSYINETSFRDNKNVEGYVVTPSEIAFYRAEAIKRGLIQGDAKAEFVRGIVESVKLYAEINAKSEASGETLARSPKVNMSAWSDAEIASFADRRWQDNTDCIYEQLWLHCGIINSVQSWNTVRRTGIPALYYPTVESNVCPNVPQRFVIPSAEYSHNPEIKPEQTPDAFGEKLFWAKEIK